MQRSTGLRWVALVVWVTTVSAKRNVITFKHDVAACSMTTHIPGCAKMIKCYGRRLVVDATMCDDNLVQSPAQWWAQFSDKVENVEADLLASTATFGVNSEDIVKFADRNWAARQMNLELMWRKSNGSDTTVVGVVDTGLHRALVEPLFKHGVLPGFDFVTDTILSGDQNGRDDDYGEPIESPVACGSPQMWHGSQVAALVGGQDGTYRGAATNVKILPVRALGRCAQGHASDVADAVVWASGLVVDGIHANPNKAHIIVLPFSGKGECPSYLQSSVSYAVAQGSIIVAAAGNDHADANSYWPGNCFGVLNVGASTADNDLALYSNLHTHVSAPGGNKKNPIITLAPGPTGNALIAHATTGTSLAAALAAGFLAISMDVYKDKFAIGNSVKPFVDKCPKTRCGNGILSFYHDEVEIVLPAPEQPQEAAYYKCSSSGKVATSVRDPFPFETRVYRHPGALNPKNQADLDPYLSRVLKEDNSVQYYHEGKDWTSIVLDPATQHHEDDTIEYFDETAQQTVVLDYWATLNTTIDMETRVSVELFPPEWNMQWLDPNYTDSFGYWNPETGSWARKEVPCQGPIPPKAQAAVLPSLPFGWSFNVESSFTEEDMATVDSLSGQTFANADITCTACSTVTIAGKKFLRTKNTAGMDIFLRSPAFNLPQPDETVGYVVREWEFPMKPVSMTFGSTLVEHIFYDEAGTASYRPMTMYMRRYMGWITVRVRERYYGGERTWMLAKIPAPMVVKETDDYDIVVRFKSISDIANDISMHYIKVVADTRNPGYVQSGWTRLETMCSARGCLRHYVPEKYWVKPAAGWWNDWHKVKVSTGGAQYAYFNSLSITYHHKDSYVDIDSGYVNMNCGPTMLSQILTTRPPLMKFHAQDYDETAKIWYDSSGNDHHATHIEGTPQKVTEIGNGAELPVTELRNQGQRIFLPAGSYPANYTICAIFRTRKHNEDPQETYGTEGPKNSIIGFYGTSPDKEFFGLTWSETLTWQAKCVGSGGGYTKKGYMMHKDQDGEAARIYHQLPDRGDPSLELPIGENNVQWSVSSVVIWDTQFSVDDVAAMQKIFKASLSDYKVNLKYLGACQGGLAVADKCRFASAPNPSPLYARYLASDWDAANQKLLDSSGNERHSVSAVGTIQSGSEAGFGASVNVPFIKGDTDASILFDEHSVPSQFTICTVSRYTGDPIVTRASVTQNYTTQAGGMIVNQEADVHFIDPKPVNRGRIVRGNLGPYRAYQMPDNPWEINWNTNQVLQQNTSSVGWFHGHSEYGVATAAYGDWDVKTYPQSNVDAPDTDWLVTCGQNRREVNSVLANDGLQVSRMERIVEPGNKALSEPLGKQFIYGGTPAFYVEGMGDIPLKIGEPTNAVLDGSNIQCQTVSRNRTLCDQQESNACLTVTSINPATSSVTMRTICSVVHGARIYCWGFGGSTTSVNYLDGDLSCNYCYRSTPTTHAILPPEVQAEIDAGAKILWVTVAGDVDYAAFLDSGTIMVASTSTVSHITKKTSTSTEWVKGRLHKVDLDGYKAFDFNMIYRAYCVIEQDISELEPKRVACWGYNDKGQLGNPDATTENYYYGSRLTVPLNLTEGETPEKLFSFGLNAIGVITSLGRVKWWGRDFFDNSIGYGKAGENPVSPFMQYETGDDIFVKQASMGEWGVCGIRLEDDKLVCWGTRVESGNNYFQLHPNDDYSPNVNTAISRTLQLPTTYDILPKYVSLGNLHTCIIRLDDERVYCWGNNLRSQTGIYPWSKRVDYDPNRPLHDWQVSTLSTGISSTCVVRKDTGQAYCSADDVSTGVVWATTTSQDTIMPFPAITADYGCSAPGLTSSASLCSSQLDTFGCYSCADPITYEVEECLDTQETLNNASSWAVNSIYVWDRHLSQNDMSFVTKQIYKSLTDSTIDPSMIGGCEAGHALPDYCLAIIEDFTCGPAAACPPGQQFDLATSACGPCPVGTASRTWSVKDCPVCPPGSFADEPGMTKCTKCGWHEYSDAEGATSPDTCTPCPEGSFTEKKGAASLEACLSCPSS